MTCRLRRCMGGARLSASARRGSRQTQARDRPYATRVATFRYDEVFAGREQTVFSELLLIELPRRRLLKVRSTAPLAQAAVAEGSLLDLMERLDWAP